MKTTPPLLAAPAIEDAIFLVRGQRVMLDRDLAALYGVTTGNLNKAVQRNRERFPGDFMFQLTTREAETLIFQFGRSKKRGGSRHCPYVFRQEDGWSNFMKTTATRKPTKRPPHPGPLLLRRRGRSFILAASFFNPL